MPAPRTGVLRLAAEAPPCEAPGAMAQVVTASGALVPRHAVVPGRQLHRFRPSHRGPGRGPQDRPRRRHGVGEDRARIGPPRFFADEPRGQNVVLEAWRGWPSGNRSSKRVHWARRCARPNADKYFLEHVQDACHGVSVPQEGAPRRGEAPHLDAHSRSVGRTLRHAR